MLDISKEAIESFFDALEAPVQPRVWCSSDALDRSERLVGKAFPMGRPLLHSRWCWMRGVSDEDLFAYHQVSPTPQGKMCTMCTNHVFLFNSDRAHALRHLAGLDAVLAARGLHQTPSKDVGCLLSMRGLGYHLEWLGKFVNPFAGKVLDAV